MGVRKCSGLACSTQQSWGGPDVLPSLDPLCCRGGDLGSYSCSAADLHLAHVRSVPGVVPDLTRVRVHGEHARDRADEGAVPGDAVADAFQRSYFDSISLFTPQAKVALYQPAMREQLQHVDSFATVAKPWFEEAQHFDRINQALYLDMQLLLSGNNLVKPDRMGMAVSIEARTPFLDWRMMELAFRSRGNTKLHGGDKKHWYKKAAAPLIGDDLAYRKKQMFTVPIGEWFRGESHAWLRSTLQGSELLSGLFNPERIGAMLDAHRDGSANFTRELRALAALGLWGGVHGK
mgnify:CR=1 FL=1